MPPHSAPDSLMLRRAFGCFPTGVTVVTTRTADGNFAGLTVNSYTSLSLEPPLILWALASHSTSLRAFESAKHFAVNILAEDQAALSRRFASRARDKFHDVATRPGIGGAPLLEGCSAHIECRMHSAQPGGDHVLFVGQVVRVDVLARTPLVYVGGRYRKVGLPAD